VLESFPLPGGRRRFVAPAPADAPDDPAVSAALLRDALEARGEHEAAASVDSAAWFAIRRAVAPRLRHDRIFAIGDAAHEVSPIGGQGMNLGLLDAATLAPLLVAWLRTGAAPDLELQRWEARRVRSARRAAALATMNTLLGRPLSPRADATRRALLRATLATPAATLLAHAYAMGFDADA
jgi:2-polyprenyl-6-methoxyphenol hydroxylase-like FAD-dependent oxidoreductase